MGKQTPVGVCHPPPSAVPTRRPQVSAIPSARISPVSRVIGRTSEILNSSVVWPMPLSSFDSTASPIQLSSKVAERPPCTPPAGLRCVSFGTTVMTTRPLSASVMSYPRVRAIVLSGKDHPRSPRRTGRLTAFAGLISPKCSSPDLNEPLSSERVDTVGPCLIAHVHDQPGQLRITDRKIELARRPLSARLSHPGAVG